MQSLSTRTLLRLVHLVIGIAISAFIYSPTLQSNATFEALLQFVAIPALGISGLLMWKPRQLRQLLKG